MTAPAGLVPHHADLDLDASTAVRFHFLEFLASIPWRQRPAHLLPDGRAPIRTAVPQTDQRPALEPGDGDDENRLS